MTNEMEDVPVPDVDRGEELFEDKKSGMGRMTGLN